MWKGIFFFLIAEPVLKLTCTGSGDYTSNHFITEKHYFFIILYEPVDF